VRAPTGRRGFEVNFRIRHEAIHFVQLLIPTLLHFPPPITSLPSYRFARRTTRRQFSVILAKARILHENFTLRSKPKAEPPPMVDEEHVSVGNDGIRSMIPQTGRQSQDDEIPQATNQSQFDQLLQAEHDLLQSCHPSEKRSRCSKDTTDQSKVSAETPLTSSSDLTSNSSEFQSSSYAKPQDTSKRHSQATRKKLIPAALSSTKMTSAHSDSTTTGCTGGRSQ
jgi:hypothetical protein